MGELGGKVEFDEYGLMRKLNIKVDKNVDDHLQFVIHELIHVAFYETFLWRVDETLEEVMVEALDRHFYTYICSKKSRRERWRQVIERKFSESDTRKPRPVAELVDRRADEARNEESTGE